MAWSKAKALQVWETAQIQAEKSEWLLLQHIHSQMKKVIYIMLRNTGEESYLM